MTKSEVILAAVENGATDEELAVLDATPESEFNIEVEETEEVKEAPAQADVAVKVEDTASNGEGDSTGIQEEVVVVDPEAKKIRDYMSGPDWFASKKSKLEQALENTEIEVPLTKQDIASVTTDLELASSPKIVELEAMLAEAPSMSQEAADILKEIESIKSATTESKVNPRNKSYQNNINIVTQHEDKVAEITNRVVDNGGDENEIKKQVDFYEKNNPEQTRINTANYEVETVNKALDNISTANVSDTYSSYSDTEEESTELNNLVEQQIIEDLSIKDMGRAAENNYTLSEKEDIIRNAKHEVIGVEYEKANDVYNSAVVLDFVKKRDDLDARIKAANKYDDEGLLLPFETEGEANEYNDLVNQYNALDGEREKVNDLVLSAKSRLETTFTELGFNAVDGTISNNFEMTDDYKGWRDKYVKERGFWGGTYDGVATFVQGGVNIASDATIGTSVWLAGLMDETVNEESRYYDGHDAVSDSYKNYANFNWAGTSDYGADILDKDGNYTINARSTTKTIANMLPFTVGVILSARKGNLKPVKSLWNTVGPRFLTSPKGRSTIRMVDASYRMTVNDNFHEGKDLGLDDGQSYAYSSMKSFGTGLSQMIMPDANFLGSTAGKTILKGFVSNLRNSATKKAIGSATKQFVINMGKELGEEELELAFGDIAKYSVGLQHSPDILDLRTQKETIAATLMLSGSLGSIGTVNDIKNAKKQVYQQYKDRGQDIIDVLDDNLKVANAKFENARTQKSKDNHQATINQINDAKNYGQSIINAVNSAPENVSDSQVDLLIQKQGLVKQKQGKDKAISVGIDNQIKEIDEKISNSVIKQAEKAKIKKIETTIKGAIEKGDLKGEVTEMSTKEIADIEEEGFDSKTASNEYGFIAQKSDGSFNIILNKDKKLVATEAHEFAHAVLFKTIGNDKDVQNNLGDALIDHVANIEGDKSRLGKRLAAYGKFTKDGEFVRDDNFGEEVITIMSESIVDGSLKFEETLFTKIGDNIRRFFQKIAPNTALGRIKLNTGKDVFNFVKDYSQNIKDGKINKAILNVAKKGAKGKLVDGGSEVKPGMQLSKATPLEAINELIPSDIKTKEDYNAFVQNRRLFPAVFMATMDNGVISNYVKSKSIGDEYNDAIKSVQNRLINFDPEATRKDGSVVGPEGFGEFVFANTRFGKLDAKKKLFEAGEKLKKTTTIDTKEAKELEDTSTSIEVEDKSKARNLRDFDIEVEDGLVDAEIEAEVEALLEKSPDDVEVQMEKLILGDIRKSLDGIIGKIAKDKKTGKRGPTAEYEAFIRNEYLEIVQSLGMETIRNAYRPWFEKKKIRTEKYKGVSPKTDKVTNYVKDVYENTTNKREYIRWFLEGNERNLTERRTALIRRIARRKAKIATDNYIEANSKHLDKIAEAKLRKVSRAIENTQVEQKSFDSIKYSKNKILPTRLSQEFSAIFYRGNNGKPLVQKGTIWTGYVNPYTNEPQSFVDKGRIWEQAFANYFMKNGIEGLKVLSEIASEVDGMADFVFEYNGKVENHELKASVTAFMGSISISNLKNGKIEFATDTHNNLLEQVDVKGFMKGYKKRVDFVNKGIEKLNLKIKDSSEKYTLIDYDVTSGKPQNIPYELYMDKKGFGNKMFYQLKADQAVIENHYKSKKDKNGIGVRSLSFVGTKTGNMSLSLDSESILNLPRLDADVDVNFTFRNGGSKIVNGNKVISLSLGVQFKISKLNNVKSEKLPRGLRPLLKQGSIATKKMGEDALLKLSDGFENLNNEQADEISGFLDVAIENMQDGYAKDATKNLKQFNKACKDALNKQPKILDITIKEDLQKALGINFSKSIEGRKLNKAINFSRSTNNPTKGITVLDFDDTLATSKSLIRFTKPDGTTGTLNAEQYASTYQELTELGYAWDFSEFNKVVKGKIAPLFQKALKLQGKFGPENMFVLTARPSEAAPAIFTFLQANGLNIPLENITGLANSTAEAKANWMAEKVGDGYNDFYFADDALQNVTAVKNMLNQFDVKSKVQQARVKFSKSINENFNSIIEQTTGIESKKVFSDAQAKIRGHKSKYKSVIPPSAQDFVGLLYNFLGKGKKGEQDMAFFKKALIDPFARGIDEINSSRQNAGDDYVNLKKAFPGVKKIINKKIDGLEFTNDQAARVYLWDKAGFEVPGLSKRDLKSLVEHVEGNSDLKAFAEGIGVISKKDAGYSKPGDYWLAENIASDLLSDGAIGDARADFLAEWQQNADQVFSKENLNKIEAIYGGKFREALEDILYRMKTGKNRPAGGGRLVNTYMNWVNNSVGAIMFLNMRSATLQTISATNYINWTDNNPLKAAAAFGNQKQFWTDFSMIWNSPYLKQRRSGNQRGINEAELSAAVAGAENKAKAALNYLLKKGFTPTQLADSFAISIGGAPFYRNRAKKYVKEGMSQEQAESQAFLDFRETTEVSQQSARPDMISQQQASPLGRLILSFQNTPMQYARVMNKATRDLANGRGDYKTHISKIVYYGVVQSIIFGALQSAIYASLGEDDEEEFDGKKERILNQMVDSWLTGIGYGGKAIGTVKNTIMEYLEQREKGFNSDHTYTILTLLSFSPPIGSKLRKIYSSIQTEEFNRGVFEKRGLSLDNPAWSGIGNVIEGATNAPLGRISNIMLQLDNAMDSSHEWWQRVALLLGQNTWDLGIKDPDIEAIKTEVKEEKKIATKERAKVKKEEKKKEKAKENVAVIEENKKKSKKDGVCSAVGKSGGRCGNVIVEGKSFCTVHEKATQNSTGKKSQCKKIKKGGKQCGMQTSAKSGLCYYHD